MNNPIPRISLPDTSHDDAVDLSPASPERKDEGQQLRETLPWLRSQIEQRLQVLLESVEQNLIDPLQSTAHEAAAIHTALVKTSHFDDPVEQVAPRLRWVRVRDYRRDTMARVIAPLRNQLAELDLGAALHEQWHTFWNDLASLPPHVPESITRPEPETLYASSSRDSVLVALRKRLVRMHRRLQRRPSSSTQDAFYAQEVPLRALAAYHLRVRLPHRLAEHERATGQHLARAIAAFERAVTTWTHRLLDAERHLDCAAHHVPEDADLSLPDDADPSERIAPFAASPSPPLAPSDIWAAVNAEAKALDQELRTLSALGFGDRPAQVKSAVQSAWSDLNTDIDQADSFLLARKDRTIPEDPSQTPHSPEVAANWTAWYRQATDRVAFCETLAALRDATYARQEALLRALVDTGLEPLTTIHADALRALRALHEEAAELFDNEPSAESLAVPLRDLRDRSVQLATTELTEPLQKAYVPDRLRETLDTHLTQFDRLIDEEPASFELHGLAPPSADIITPDVDAREVNVRSIAQDHFDTFFADALRDAIQSFGRRIREILSEDDVSPLLRSDFDAALEALDRTSPDDAGTVTAAREFVLNGLTRSADAIDAQDEHARTAFPPLASAVNRAFTTAWTDLHDRARAESRLREHLLELRTITGGEAQDVSEQAERRFHAPRNRPSRNPSQERDHADASRPKNRSAMEDAPMHKETFLETLETLATTEHVLSSLPFAYRRLFAFRPVTDPALLAGRRDDLERVRRHVNQRQHGLMAPLAITGPPGCGRTSFLSVAQKRFLRDAEVHWITLDDRLRSTSAFAERIARALDLSLSTSDDGALTLDQVREHLLAQPRPAAPRVCVVEHLEHLFLRTVHGTTVADRVLTFMSRTSAHILWLPAASASGWRVLNQTASTASTLMLRHRLAPIDRSALETLIMTRHRRSGLRVAFDPPENPSPPLRRRLRKTQTEERTQALLRTAYFDRLHAHCSSNIMLALFYWLRSVRLDEESLTIRVRPIQPLNIEVLERFSMQQNFVLKALIDHATLTVEEYSEIASVSADTSLALFESLGHTLLLQPAGALPLAPSPTPIEPGRRYRIRPLLLHPVLQHLRTLNLLY